MIEDSIEVPDIVSDDGADAVSTIEAEGLTVTLADAGSDSDYGSSSHDAARDTTGCLVTDQGSVAGELTADGDEVTVTVDCRQVDWENNEGSDWEAFNAAYGSGFGCGAI